MGTKEVSLEITGDESQLVASLNRARVAVIESTASMREALGTVTESFKQLGESFAAFTAIMAGGAAFKEVITQTKEITSESIKLGKSLGISTTEASAYAVAIESVGGNADDFADASRGLTRQLKTNEKGLNDMGVATRDASGHLKSGEELMWEAVEAVNSYTQGTDRNLAAQTAFGRGASANSAILKLNKEALEEARKEAEDLGLVVGVENIQAYAENKKATAGAMATLHGLEKAIGDAVLPVLTELGTWFREIGPAAIVVIKGAVGGLVSVFWGLWTVANIVLDYIQFTFHAVADIVEQTVEAASAAIKGHFGEAGEALKKIPKLVSKDWGTAFDAMVADATKARDKITNLFSNPTAASAPEAGKSFNLKKKEDEGPDNRFLIYKNGLEQMAQAKGDFDRKDIEADTQYWQAILANTVGNSRKDVQLREQITREILNLKKRAHDEEVRAEEEKIRSIEDLQLGELERAKQNITQQAALGNITRRQELQAEVELENQRFAIQQAALQRRLALAQFDLLGQQKIKDQELKLEQKHALDVQKILDKEALEERKVWNSLFQNMRTGFAETIQGFLKGTSTVAGALRGLFNDITGSVINSLSQMAAKNLEVMLQSMLLGKTAAMAQIKSDAAAAASGAYKAVAGIPYVGPFLAPAAAAVAYGATLAFGTSAKGGYDIPGGINPLVQTHAREMILPEKYADVIRNMAGAGGGSNSGSTVHINAIDAASFVKWSRTNPSALSGALRNLNQRNMR